MGILYIEVINKMIIKKGLNTMTQTQIALPTLFPVGDLYATKGVRMLLSTYEVMHLVNRHRSGDYGDLCKDDIKENQMALETGGRIFSSYLYNNGKYYVITEADRQTTTVLLPEEY